MKIFKNWLVLLMAICVMGLFTSAHAMEAPDMLVKRISKDVMDAAKANKEIKKGNQKQIFALVEAKVFPYVNFQRMTAMAAGHYWRQATPVQKQKLAREFRNLLVYTYSTAISKIDNEKLEFKPLRLSTNATDVIVRSRIIRPRGGEPIELDYRMEKQANGWKIYDFNVMGAWLVETYKGTFASEINRSGIDGLIHLLATKNRQLAAGKPAK